MYISPSTHTESYAFSMSRSTNPVCLFLLNPCVTQSVSRASWATVEWCLRKANCSWGMMSSFSAWWRSRFATDFSNSLLKAGSKLIGLYDPGSRGGLFGFGIATIRARFHFSGKCPIRKIELYRYVRRVRISGVKCQIMMLAIPSSPGAVLDLSLRILLITSVRVMGSVTTQFCDNRCRRLCVTYFTL